VSPIECDDDFEKAWVSNYVPKDSAKDAMIELKNYAYKEFDKLDMNGNGYIEKSELESFLKDPALDGREKSFITFLLNNQDAIAHSVHEGSTTVQGGISRLDLDAYFKIVIAML
jgi:hypothetical protein